MATAAQIAANRANAQHSPGPKSADGKARSSQNNFRHGFRSQSVLLPGDDPAEYEALLEELTDHFEANGLTEERFIREMADAEWRLRRVRAHQEDLLTAKIEELAQRHPDATPVRLQALAFEALHSETCFAQFLRYESKFERQYERAYNGWMLTREKVSLHHSRQVRAHLDSIMAGPFPPREAAPAESLVLPDEPNSVPRNAPCPCGSGQKYKRCCGKNAPAVLHQHPNAA